MRFPRVRWPSRNAWIKGLLVVGWCAGIGTTAIDFDRRADETVELTCERPVHATVRFSEVAHRKATGLGVSFSVSAQAWEAVEVVITPADPALEPVTLELSGECPECPRTMPPDFSGAGSSAPPNDDEDGGAPVASARTADLGPTPGGDLSAQGGIDLQGKCPEQGACSFELTITCSKHPTVKGWLDLSAHLSINAVASRPSPDRLFCASQTDFPPGATVELDIHE